MNLSELNRKEIENLPEMKKINIFLEENNIKLNWISNFRQIIYHYTHDLKYIPFCRCGNPVNFRSFYLGYRKNCSPKCAANSEETKLNLRLSKIEKYGDPNYNNSKKMLHTKNKKYGDPHFNNRESAIKTNIERYGFTSPMKNDQVKKKSMNTKLEKYGVATYNNPDKIKEFWKNASDDYRLSIVNKIEQTKLEIYGDENYNNSSKMVETKVERGILRDEKSNLDFKDYKNRVRARTNSKRKKIYSEWDGFDFYTGDYIKENINLNFTDPLYPTIDHKIPIIVAYKMGMSVEEASSLENLCITTRVLNSIKKDMILEDFINRIQDMNFNI